MYYKLIINRLIILIDAEKAFDKLHHLFMIKSAEQIKNRKFS